MTEQRILNSFWWERLTDHLDFFLLKLAPSETEWIEKVNKLRVRSQKQLNNALDDKKINIKVLDDIRDLKTELLALKLQPGAISLNLPPTFISHMLNEARMYEKELSGEAIPEILLHELWVVDAEGHAEALYSELDPIDQHRKLVKKRVKILKRLAKKVVELKNYDKYVELPESLLSKLTIEASMAINDFRELMEEMQDKPLLGILDPLLLDHMIREEFYYLYKMNAPNVQPSDFIRSWE